jgi:phage protein U
MSGPVKIRFRCQDSSTLASPATNQTSRSRNMADSGEPYIMIDGEGRMQGWWIIESIQENSSVFFVDGKPRKIDFTLSLKQSDNPNATRL